MTSGQTLNFNDSVAVYFQEIKANTAHYKDLWNLDIYGPVLLVNPGSRKLYANLLGSNRDKVTLCEPTLITSDNVSGNGWVLELNKGYIVEKNSSDRNYLLKRK